MMWGGLPGGVVQMSGVDAGAIRVDEPSDCVFGLESAEVVSHAPLLFVAGVRPVPACGLRSSAPLPECGTASQLPPDAAVAGSVVVCRPRPDGRCPEPVGRATDTRPKVWPESQ